MAFVKVDDRLSGHPKVLAACAEQPHSFGLYVAALCYANSHKTDGFIPVGAVPILLPVLRRTTVIAQALVRAKLWHPAEHGFQIHDYLEHQTSRAQIEDTRAWDVKRKELHRNRDLITAIRSRDGDKCRYCAIAVDWNNRRGANGGTYDHVIPRGANSLANVVVACRRCNNVKGPRTPEEAGMDLIPVKSRLSPVQNGGQVAT